MPRVVIRVIWVVAVIACSKPHAVEDLAPKLEPLRGVTGRRKADDPAHPATLADRANRFDAGLFLVMSPVIKPFLPQTAR